MARDQDSGHLLAGDKGTGVVFLTVGARVVILGLNDEPKNDSRPLISLVPLSRSKRPRASTKGRRQSCPPLCAVRASWRESLTCPGKPRPRPDQNRSAGDYSSR